MRRKNSGKCSMLMPSTEGVSMPANLKHLASAFTITLPFLLCTLFQTLLKDLRGKEISSFSKA